LFYELFLDEDGRKISKSVGKGLTIESWIRFAPLESLLYYIFQNPKQAKRLFWGMVPKSVDEYLLGLNQYHRLDSNKQPDSAIWHIFNKGKHVPRYDSAINFSLIHNLISAVGADDKNLILEYLKRYDASLEKFSAIIEDLVQKAMNYYREHILPHKTYRSPTDKEREMIRRLRRDLAHYRGDDEKELQTIAFDVARVFGEPPAHFFKMFYEVVFGQERGPRFGTFVQLVGKEKALSLLDACCGL
jgi:lysyl-tRNA synthetase, class I